MFETFHKSYATTPDGLLMIADGIGSVRRWDGLAASTDTAGVIAPTAALTVRSSGKGPITGTYQAYSRFVDSRTNLSNLSPISDAFRPYTTGRILTCTNSTPVAVGSFAHGLLDGDKVTVTGVQGTTAANGNWTITVHDENNFSLNGSAGNGAHTAGTGTWVGGLTTPPGRGLILTATNASPIVCGSFAHGLSTGNSVTVRGGLGNTAVNGTWTITVIDANNFSLDTSVGNGVYTASSAFWTGTLVAPSSGTIILSTNTSPINVGSVAHGLSTGNSVVISDVEGNTATNGTFTITVVDSNNFTLDSSTGNGGYSGGGKWVGGSGPPFFSAAISGASNAEPIVITSTEHGLTTGDAVTITGVQGNTAANGTWTIFRITADTFSLDESVGDGTYTASTGTWTAGARAILYTSVPVSTETKVTRRQVLRNTDGQADTFYVDLDTTDLVDTSLESTKPDEDLAAEEAVPILTDEGALNANLYDVPPNYKAVLSHHRGRMFYAAEVAVRQGHAQVTNGSTTVTGIATNWKSTFATRTFYVVGSTASYTISSVNEGSQTLTLSSAYAGSTDKFAVYAIRPPATERRLIYFSESGLPEAVPPINQISLAETDDEITGLAQAGSYLYFLERHHVWRFSMQADPALDGDAWLAARRGCINNRCHVTVSDVLYLLDSDGIYSFNGGDVSPVGNTIQDLFRPSDSPFQLNLQASEYFHASHYPNQEVIRWFVSFSGQDLPRHAIAFNYRQGRWWIEEYSRPISCSAVGDLNGKRIVFVGSDAKTTLALWNGTLDGPDHERGRVHGTVSSATITSLTDSSATFPSAGVVGNPISIVDGRGKSQTRRVSSVSGTTINVSQPWLTVPDTTSKYQLGGVNWRYQTGFFRYVESEDNSPTRVEVVFRPQEEESLMDLRVFEDFSDTATEWQGVGSLDDGVGIKVADFPETGDESHRHLICDLTKENGLIDQRVDRHRDIYIDGSHYLSVDLRGTSSEEQTKVYEVTIDGAVE